METPIEDTLHPAPSETAHTVASWLLDIINRVASWCGLGRDIRTEETIYLVIVIAIAFAIGWLLQKAIYYGLLKIVKMRKGELWKMLLERKTLQKCCYIVPPLVVMALAPFALIADRHALSILYRVAGIYVLIAFGIALCAVYNFGFTYFNTHDNARKIPIKGIENVAKGITWMVIFIVVVSIIVQRSPAMLLTGLGAFAAALMLVFKDSILGFVAGIQMSENDMIHVGDWIVVPGTPANGLVLDMTLTAVKVQNWDNTIVTVPPYTLVSTSFQNWRGMKQSGCRRIARSLTVDLTTVHPIGADEVDAIVRRHPELAPFVEGVRKSGTMQQNDGGLTPINGTLETNLGLFRAYACLHIFNNPFIDNTQQILVRLIDPTTYGLPLQFYCFTATTDWNKYEAIQSQLTEHFTTVCADFGLGIYSGSTLTVSGDITESAPQPVMAASAPSASAPQPAASGTPAAESADKKA